jgi:3-isopropylmalate/(R)-2-methylmalate dehydratase small subunit
LPIIVPYDAHKRLLEALADDPAATVTVDLANQSLTLPDGSSVIFPIDAFAKHCMLEGIDELGYILQQEPAIAAYETKRPLTINTLSHID